MIINVLQLLQHLQLKLDSSTNTTVVYTKTNDGHCQVQTNWDPLSRP